MRNYGSPITTLYFNINYIQARSVTFNQMLHIQQNQNSLSETMELQLYNQVFYHHHFKHVWNIIF
jgi:hypothetical protein